MGVRPTSLHAFFRLGEGVSPWAPVDLVENVLGVWGTVTPDMGC